MLDQMYRQAILDHYRQKRNFKELLSESVHKVHYKNPTCGDVITLFIESEQYFIKNVAFLGEGCSISMASSSMMTELIQYKSIKEIALLRKAFEELIRTGKLTNDQVDLGDSVSLQGVHQFKARHNCALMPWQALDKVFKDNLEYRPFQ
ncbi:SUF system NifU family Fe-S cluster assembly protein [Metabacillus litoralis]|uniref:Fe-S cluster assembly sulfur transfer protein SufU n=1 Tax=Metabacillus litoralis TaxID=152268 RepID=UPI001B98EB24|nr:SUF system NifU family Fe-S cluster assembly protein [Metabacillus litoralis]UHA60113.1 SUF system NifU family Fe-S cluster assembly protein [Metabacillus litoralis]